ncbi:MAG: hypothetical protein HC797_01560 [Anaerolineales bacterium]|nr:hypothetical protein [Anaerolineales bacterium]
MMSIVYIFWMYVILFGIIGAMRGWAKELLVIFSVVTALAVNLLLEKYIPLVRDLDKAGTSNFLDTRPYYGRVGLLWISNS